MRQSAGSILGWTELGVTANWTGPGCGLLPGKVLSDTLRVGLITAPVLFFQVCDVSMRQVFLWNVAD
jgi:hypothetical protein